VCVVDQQVQRAFDLSLAALLGEGIYNFGELVRAGGLLGAVLVVTAVVFSCHTLS